METNEHLEERRREILLAAEKTFDKRGYAATTMDAIAVAARVSKGSLYNYFKSKEHLFEQVFTHRMLTAKTEVEDLLGTAPTAGEKLRRFLDYWSSEFQVFRRLGRLVLEFWAAAARERQGQIAESFAKMYAYWRGRLASIIAEGMSAGEFSSRVNSQVAASLILAILDGVKIQAIFDVGINVNAKFLTALKDQILAGLTATAPTTQSQGETHEPE